MNLIVLRLTHSIIIIIAWCSKSQRDLSKIFIETTLKIGHLSRRKHVSCWYVLGFERFAWSQSSKVASWCCINVFPNGASTTNWSWWVNRIQGIASGHSKWTSSTFWSHKVGILITNHLTSQGESGLITTIGWISGEVSAVDSITKYLVSPRAFIIQFNS